MKNQIVSLPVFQTHYQPHPFERSYLPFASILPPIPLQTSLPLNSLGDWPRYLGCGQCLQLNLTDWPVVFRIYHLGHEHYHKIQLTSYIVHDSLHSSLQLPPNLKSNKKTWKNNGSEWNNGKTRLR